MLTTEIITKNSQLEHAIKVGIIRWSEKNPDAALAYFEEIRPLFDSAEPLLKAKFHNNLGLVYKQKAETDPECLDKAIQEYELVKLYLEQTDDPLAIAIIENNIANVQLLAGRPDKAHEHLDRAENVFKGLDDTYYAQALESRARAYYAQNLLTEAAFAINASEALLLYGVELDPLVETLKTKRIVHMALEAEVCRKYGDNNAAAKAFGITVHGVRKKIKEYFG